MVRDTLNAALCNGRGLDQWLKHVHNPNKEGGDQSSGVVGEQPRSAVIFEEEEESSEEESAVGSDKEEEDEESSEDGDEEFGGREYESSDNNPSNKSCRNSPEPAHIQSQSNPSSSIQPPIHQPSITFAPEPLCEPVPDLEQLPIVPLEPESKFLPPSLEAVKKAHKDISLLLKPPRRMGVGYKDPELDLVLHGHLELMKMFLWAYMESEATSGGLGGTWMATSLKVANAAERGPWLACHLREWSRAYILSPKAVPTNIYGKWNVSLLEDEDLSQEIHLHLQSLGKFVKAMDIVHTSNESPPQSQKNNLACHCSALDESDGLLMDKRAERPIC